MSPKLTNTINYLIYLSNKSDKKSLTNKKLQKLLYYSQAWNLVLRNKSLFKEDFEAWVHGPAIPIVYKKFKNCGSCVIDVKVKEDDYKNLSGKGIEIISEVWKVYGKYDAGYLELLTHNEKPWQNARNGHLPYEASKNIISKQDMKEYYEQKK